MIVVEEPNVLYAIPPLERKVLDGVRKQAEQAIGNKAGSRFLRSPGSALPFMLEVLP